MTNGVNKVDDEFSHYVFLQKFYVYLFYMANIYLFMFL